MGGGSASHSHLPVFIGQDPGNDPGQGRLAAAAFSRDSHEFPCPEGQVDLVQAHDHGLAGSIVFGDIGED